LSLIRFDNVSKYYGANLIFEKLSWQINNGEKIGLIGVNGSGKTTLLKMICNEIHPETGNIIFQKNIRFGYLSQHIKINSNLTIYQEILDSLIDINELKAQMEEIEHKMTLHNENIDALTEKYGDLQHQFEESGGYNIDFLIDKVLNGLGFSKNDWDKKIEILSGGQKSRVMLARLLLQKPDLILLDEPTNHLDINAISWLEEFLAEYQKSVLIVSHDRYFLDKTVSKIAEIENFNLTEYKGNYSKFIEQKTQKIALQEKLYTLQKAKIEEKQDFIRRNIAGQNTKQATSRIKELEKMHIIKPPSQQKKITLKFDASKRGGNDVLTITDLCKKYDTKVLFENLNFKVERNNRIGIVGTNGTGKTTLLKIIIGEENQTDGEIKIGANIEIGYYDQHLNNLDEEKIVIDEVWQIKPNLTEFEMRKYLAKFLFYDEDVFLEIKNLSGGEKSRVALAKIILSGANFLILDEPTNHLDIFSRMALEDALQNYEGTILTVSHDRYFLDKIANKIILFEDGKSIFYDGNYSYYDQKRKEDAKTQQENKTTNKYQQYQQFKDEKKQNKPKIKTRPPFEIEKEIQNVEEEIKKIDKELAKPEIYSDYQKTQILNDKYEEFNDKLAILYEEWEKSNN